tara:strand:- start:1964 stop:2146 length:183 start_codon:yes stop_codon:yes gene_type:complete
VLLDSFSISKISAVALLHMLKLLFLPIHRHSAMSHTKACATPLVKPRKLAFGADAVQLIP